MSATMKLGAPAGVTGCWPITPPNMDVLLECSTCHRIRVRDTTKVSSRVEDKQSHLCPCGGLWVALWFVPRHVLVVRDEMAWVSKLEKICEDIEQHNVRCGGRILPNDDPASRLIGWACIGCGKTFHLRVVEFKKESQMIPDALLAKVLTPQGRLELARRLSSGGRLFVWDEQVQCI